MQDLVVVPVFDVETRALGGAVGTSTRLPGPTGPWSKAAEHLTKWQDAGADLDKGAARAGSYLRALRETVASDPEAFGLQAAGRAAGLRLVDVLDALRREGTQGLAPLEEETPEERREAFLVGVVNGIAGTGGTVVDTVMRRAAVRCGQRLLDADSPIRDAVEAGEATGELLSDELFCAVYELFFEDIVKEFIATMIAEKIKLAVPLLPGQAVPSSVGTRTKGRR